jgi:hypothetical protein
MLFEKKSFASTLLSWVQEFLVWYNLTCLWEVLIMHDHQLWPSLPPSLTISYPPGLSWKILKLILHKLDQMGWVMEKEWLNWSRMNQSFGVGTICINLVCILLRVHCISITKTSLLNYSEKYQSFIYLPTDALASCPKKNIKIYIKTAPTCFGAVTPSSGSILIHAY